MFCYRGWDCLPHIIPIISLLIVQDRQVFLAVEFYDREPKREECPPIHLPAYGSPHILLDESVDLMPVCSFSTRCAWNQLDGNQRILC